jgi:AcrR family transcriptional regulator
LTFYYFKFIFFSEKVVDSNIFICLWRGAVVSLEISTVLEHKENLNNAFFKKKTQVRAIESDLKMVNQTIKLLSEGGVNAVTLEAVGVNAGYSRGLVSRRYGSKDQLLVRVLNYLENWLNEKSKIATNNKYGLDAINSLILSISDDFYLYREKYRAYFWLRFYGLEQNKILNECLVKSRNIREENTIKWLKEALALEELSRNVDIEMVHDFLKTSLMGLVHNWMVDPNFNIEIRLKQLVYIHLKNMFSNSHLYHSVNFWGE